MKMTNVSAGWPLGFLLVISSTCADAGNVLPSIADDLVVHYDFDHPVADNPDREADQGRSGTKLHLVNGGNAMRVDDPAYPTAGRSLQTRQVRPGDEGNDDWKAGVFDANGIPTLRAFNAVAGITLMGWVKPTGTHPAPDSTTADPGDTYNAVGLFGLLSGNSEGHLVRALVEVISVDGELRLVALGRRDDDGDSLVLATADDWNVLLPANEWTHVAATFDFDDGRMALFRNGKPLRATCTAAGDRWRVLGEPEPDSTSATDPAGIKIGGSFPQNNRERNPFNGRFDDLMFFDRELTPSEIKSQFARFGQGGIRPAQ